MSVTAHAVITEPTPFDAFLDAANDLGATVTRRTDDAFMVQHLDNERINTLWMLARAVGDVGAIFGHNRFHLARPFEWGF